MSYNSYFNLYYSTGRKGKSITITSKRVGPEKYLSLIVDGVDQGKTHLPHCVQKSKVSCFAAKPPPPSVSIASRPRL